MKETSKSVALVHSEELENHELSPLHPLKPIRLRYARRLMEASGLLNRPDLEVVKPLPIDEEILCASHGKDYVEVVKVLSAGGVVPEMGMYGFGPADNPPRKGMYEWTALTVGAAVTASDLVCGGKLPIGFAPAAGANHHALRSRASGFGIFNDCAIAVSEIVKRGARVAYVDIDCHHGDGVQEAFWDTDKVLTISIHETGESLFPGTGAPDEIGTGRGEGFSVNVPVAPYTDGKIWLQAFERIVPPLIRAYSPDVVFTQLGIDSHFLDPLTHLQLTTQDFMQAVRRLKDVALETCGKWVAVGGGGYDMGAVARAWTMVLAEMTKTTLPERIPEGFTEISGLSTFRDEEQPPIDASHYSQIKAYAEMATNYVVKNIFPTHGIT